MHRIHTRPTLPFALGLVPLALLAACGEDDPTPLDAGPRDGGGVLDSGGAQGSLLDVATDAGLGAFAEAVGTAGLAEALGGPGPFTVFAPTEAAFSAAGGLPSDPDLLANVLLHHVLPFESGASEVLAAGALRNSAGLRLPVDSAAAPPTVGGAPLEQTDLRARNGVLHTIGQVLSPPTIPELVASDTRTATLAATLDAASASVRDALAAPGPITVFAPVDSAFAQLDLAAIAADPMFLDSVLQFHVAQGQVLRGDLQTGQTLDMTNGQSLTVRTLPGGEVVLVDGQSRTARVIQEDIRLRNGVVHLVDRVLLPSRAAVNLVDTLRRSNLGSAANAVMQASLTSTLSSGGPFTMFAPTDGAFAALGSAAPSDPDLLANVLLHHVVRGSRTTQQLEQISSLPNQAGAELIFDFGGRPPTVNGVELASNRDQIATNGVVHAIEQVIVPPLVARAPDRFPSLSTLGAALQSASESVRDPLSGSGPVTLFAPVDAAFQGFDLDALVADQGRLDELLALHYASGQTLSSDLRDGQTLTMSSGVDLTVRVDGAGVTLVDGTGGTARVVTADVRLLNGVVHLIDGVLSPGHIVDQARIAGFTELLGALSRANLTTTLRTGGPFTVFAPTNAAFMAFRADLSTLRADVLETILLQHVVSGTVGSAAILGGAQLTSLANLPLPVTSSTAPRVGGARLSTTLDVPASNGVLHVVDDVIVPPTIVELAGSTPDLSTLTTAVGRASSSVQDAVSPDVLTASERPITVFAPVNSAFANQMIDPSSMTSAQLDPVLGHHVVERPLQTGDMQNGQRQRTLNGTLTFNVAMDGSVTVTDGQGNTARILTPNLRTLNGVVHVVDRVLLP